MKVRIEEKGGRGKKCRMGGTEGIPFGDFESCEGGQGVEALMVHCGAEVSVFVLELMRMAWFGVGLWNEL